MSKDKIKNHKEEARAGSQDGVKKDDKDVVIFFENEYYLLPFADWIENARKLGKGERSVLVPLIDRGTIVAHVDEEGPKFGTWSTLVNLSAILKTHREPGKK